MTLKAVRILLFGSFGIAAIFLLLPRVDVTNFVIVFGILFLFEIVGYGLCAHRLESIIQEELRLESVRLAGTNGAPSSPPQEALRLNRAKEQWNREQAQIEAEESKARVHRAQAVQEQKRRDQQRAEEERLDAERRWQQAMKHGQPTPEDRDRGACHKDEVAAQSRREEERQERLLRQMEAEVSRHWK